MNEYTVSSAWNQSVLELLAAAWETRQETNQDARWPRRICRAMRIVPISCWTVRVRCRRVTAKSPLHACMNI